MNNSYKIRGLHIENFRNHKKFEAFPIEKSVIITGKNGIGKTSILESISMLSPGRGIRSASNDEMISDFNNPHTHKEPWVLHAEINDCKISTGLIHTKYGGYKRITKVNGDSLNSNFELAKYFSVLWMTPQTDHNFLSSNTNRRKFFDRMTYNFYPNHAELVSEYEKKMKERSIILKLPKHDVSWLDILENDMANLNYEIYQLRNNIMNKIQNSITSYTGPFPRFHLNLSGKLESITHELNNKDEIISIFFNTLRNNRKIDTLSGKTNFGTHRTIFELFEYDTNMPISNCSTGEQKSMLIALILHQVYAKQSDNLISPVLLLDEITTHLDYKRRTALMEDILKLNVQVWITSTESNMFKELPFEHISISL